MQPHEKTLADLWEDIWKAGPSIIAGIIVAGALAFFFVFNAIPFYSAQMILSPAAPMSAPDISGTGNEDNFFANHFMPRKSDDAGALDFLKFENMVTGPTVAAKLLEDEKIRRGLALDKNFVFSDSKPDWTAEELAEYMSARVRMEPIGASALRKLIYMHPNREFASYFLYRLHKVTDEMIRAAVKNEAVERISYLQDMSGQQLNPEHRRALTALLLEEERLRMMASMDQPYAASVVEPPASSARPRWPDAKLVLPVFMFAGAVIGFVLYGFFQERSRVAVSFKARRKGWVRKDSTNSNERRLITKKAAE